MEPAERAELDEAAADDGIPSGTWMRMICLREARRRKRLKEQ